MKYPLLIVLLALSGCGYKFTPKQIDMWNAKGELQTDNSCGSYMQVSQEGWFNPAFEVTYTDRDGLDHEVHGIKELAVSDISSTVNAPMYGFQYDHFLGERYMDRPDGTPGELIKEGDIVVKGDNQARLVNGKWTPVKVPNRACTKQ